MRDKKNINMFGSNKTVCIAGKNQCSIDFLKYVSTLIPKNRILILPNKSDIGTNNWQPSLKNYGKKKNYKITNLRSIYKIKDLIFISIEFDSIIDPNRFLSKELFNFHFSKLFL